MNAWPVPGPALPRRDNPFLRRLGAAWLRMAGWTIAGAFPDAPRLVVAIGPHTSNWDFVHGAAAMFALDLRLAFLAKHTLFVWPFATALRWMGGLPVDRSSSHGVVEASVARLAGMPQAMLVIAPQGTRRPGARLRSGFLHIARGAGVPVVIVVLDYACRCVTIGPAFMPSEDVDADLRRVAASFEAARATGRP